jgi:signal transduction histidine kinase
MSIFQPITLLKRLKTSIIKRRQVQQGLRTENETPIHASRELGLAPKQETEAVSLPARFWVATSHELRTPLNAIIGYSEIQLAGMAGELSEEQMDYQKRILENAEYLLNLINDLLDLTKLEAGDINLKPNEIILADLVDEVVSGMQNLVKDKPLVLSAKIDSELPAVIIGDRQRLKQILVNLVSHGLKFTEEGFITFALKHASENHWQIVVQDTGSGIPSHLQPSVFDEFRQMDSTSLRQYGSTGLGLALVKRLVALMKGSIELESEPEKGTIFTITLPLIQNQHPMKLADDAKEHDHDN